MWFRHEPVWPNKRIISQRIPDTQPHEELPSNTKTTLNTPHLHNIPQPEEHTRESVATERRKQLSAPSTYHKPGTGARRRMEEERTQTQEDRNQIK